MRSKKEELENILNGFGDRLAEVMKDQEVSAYQVAKDLEIRADTIYNILNKRQYANLKLIVELLLLFPEVNANWFILNKGTKYLKDLDKLIQYRVIHEQRKKEQEAIIQSLRTVVDNLERSIGAVAADETK